MNRSGWLVIALGLTACSTESSKDDGDPIGSTDNQTTATNSSNGTSGTTGITTGPSNNTTTANNTTNTTVQPQPRRRFAGVCAEPISAADGDGCTWGWRCTSRLSLVCADGTCQCVNGEPANSFAGDVSSLCAADVETITRTVLDECGWSVTYAEPLTCSAGRFTQDAGAGCTWEWNCGGTRRAVECADDRNAGLDCSCTIGGRPNGISFAGGRSACSEVEADAIANAQSGCGWDITSN